MCRIGATSYNESIGSWLYPGNTLSQHVFIETIWQLEATLRLDWRSRRRIIIRVDAGFGTDANLEWVLRRGYQLVAKNQSGRRAGAWGQQVTEWQEIDSGRRWVSLPDQQLRFLRPTRTIAVRWLDRKGKLKHALYVVTDLHRPLAELVKLYDLRGGLEVDIREDKQGLLLTHRRKRAWHAQETLVLLNDMAHNFLVMVRRLLLADTPLANLGLYRLIHDVLTVPGIARFDEEGFLTDLQLLKSHPYAPILAEVLPRLWQ